jgi:AraC-like DNA-binding protein
MSIRKDNKGKVCYYLFMKNKISSQKFHNYSSMTQSSKNWDIHCAYKLFPHAFNGENHVIELPSMQLSYTHREGGFMHSAVSPKDSFSIAIIVECDGIATFDCIKLSKGDIVFFDDAKAYTFMSKDAIKVAIVSISNTKVAHLQSKLHATIGHYMKDSEAILGNTLQKILEVFVHNVENLNIQEIEDEIMRCITNLMTTQTPKIAKLTKSEKIVLDILEKFYGHMDGKISIKALAKQYKLSEHSLQNSFKSLFGFTPKRFLMLLKLNHVHYDLKYETPASSSVSRISQKWGFNHMGRLSQYYTELFDENPSVTLKANEIQDKSMTTKCASRQEEM